MFLSSYQKQYLKRIIGVYRYFYNRAIQYINNYNKEKEETFYFINNKDETTKIIIKIKNDDKNKFNFITLRKKINDNKPEWMNEIVVQSHLIDNAIIEATENYTKCMTNIKKTKKAFVLKFKTKKDKYQTINIEHKMLNTKTRTLFS